MVVVRQRARARNEIGNSRSKTGTDRRIGTELWNVVLGA